MRLLITGLNGTLAPHLAAEAKAAGWQLIPWSRQLVDPEDSTESALFLQRMRPDAIAHLAMGAESWAAHLAMGAESWAAQLAAYAAQAHIPFLFTSSAMVFHHQPDGPHGVSDAPNAEDDYGRYKMRCEQAIWQANPQACVARIGWQIDGEARGNNMLAALDSWQREQGKVAASQLWIPACSFMDDTARALWQLLQERASGLFHLDSNATEAWTFAELVRALACRFERDWLMETNDGYRHDQRLLGHPERMPVLSQRLSRS